MIFAVVSLSGHQFLVTKGSRITIPSHFTKKGKELIFSDVLLIADEKGSEVVVGTPKIAGASVTAELISEGRAPKVRVVKYKNKIRYVRTRGHRQDITKVKIKEIIKKKGS